MRTAVAGSVFLPCGQLFFVQIFVRISVRDPLVFSMKKCIIMAYSEGRDFFEKETVRTD